MKGLTTVTVTVPLVLPIGTSTSVTVTVPLVLPTGQGNSAMETSVPGSSRKEEFFSHQCRIFVQEKPILPFRQVQRSDGSHCEADPYFYFSQPQRRVNTYTKTVYLFHSNSSTSPSQGIKTCRINFDTKVCFIFVQPHRMSTEHTQCYSSEPVYSP
jgi:hypothetical protein